MCVCVQRLRWAGIKPPIPAEGLKHRLKADSLVKRPRWDSNNQHLLEEIVLKIIANAGHGVRSDQGRAAREARGGG